MNLLPFESFHLDVCNQPAASAVEKSPESIAMDLRESRHT